MSRRLPAPVLLFGLGLLLLQMAWVLAVPAYGGMDEVDHAYRAASVARGYWSPEPQHSTRGRGDLIPVPADIVQAAHTACADLKYMRYANCNPVSPPDAAGDVLVASAAARYNPVYYWVVGTIARPFTGDWALLAMRIATAVLSTVVIAFAVGLALRWGRSLWPVVGLALCATPTLIDSTATVAPNGLQMSAGLLMWTAGLIVIKTPALGRSLSRLLAVASAAAAVVVMLHTLGPLWVMLFLIVSAVFAPPLRLRDLVKRGQGFWLAVGITGLMTTLALSWTLTHHTNSPDEHMRGFGPIPWAELPQQLLVWVLQTMGAVPFRDIPVPTVVYAIGLSLLAVFVLSAFRNSDARYKVGVSLIVLLTVMIPVVLTALTFDKLGFAWQGRYALPLSFGLPLASVWALDGRDHIRRLSSLAAYITVTAAVAMETLSLLNVRQMARSLPGGRNWMPPSNAELVALTLGALAVLLLAVTQAQRSRLRDSSLLGAHPTSAKGQAIAT